MLALWLRRGDHLDVLRTIIQRHRPQVKETYRHSGEIQKVSYEISQNRTVPSLRRHA